MFEKFLQDLGLSEKEAKVYVSLLQVERGSINELAEKTGINRTTVYPVLETLSKKGLVSEAHEGKKITYQAEPPERLETYVERQKVLLNEKASRLKEMIPQMKSIQREQGERPVVKFYEGRDGALSAYSEFYELHEESNKEGYFIYNRNLLEEVYSSEERDKFYQMRIGKEVIPNSVYTRREGDMEFKSEGKRVRIDAEHYPILSDITIIEDRVIITTLSEQVTSILIKSRDLAVTLSSLVRKIVDNGK